MVPTGTRVILTSHRSLRIFSLDLEIMNQALLRIP